MGRNSGAAGSAIPESKGPESLPPDEGDDDALILGFLGLADSERLTVAQDFADSARFLRDGFRSWVRGSLHYHVTERT